MSRHAYHLDLEGAVEPLAESRLLFVAADWYDSSPFMWLTYIIDRKRAKHGLRLDVDKKVIIDQTGNAAIDRAIRDNAEKIWRAVIDRRRAKAPETLYTVAG